MSHRAGVDPFVFVVGPDGPRSLSALAALTGDDLSDLRRLNAEIARGGGRLSRGSVVRLPPSLAVRGHAEGGRFAVAAMEDALRALERRLDGLLVAAPPPLPTRRVSSRTERIAAGVRAESARQLARIRREHAEGGGRAAQLPFLVDAAPMARLRAEVEAAFDGRRLGLRALEPTPVEFPDDDDDADVPDAARHTVVDAAEDFCVAEHTHRWEFTFLAPAAAREVQDAWAVLACQSLAALLDAFECRNCIPVHTSRNAFLFIGGTFYIDDRHAHEAGYEDLTVPIRFFDPVKNEIGGTPNATFGACPVRYVSQTTFADLHLRMGEFCLLRHLGWCNHYFYLSSVTSLRGEALRERKDFPHRVMKAPTRAVRCRMCQQFPATIACYDDELSPESPCPYCEPCYTLLHANKEGVVEEENFIAIKLPEGKYFTL